MAKQTNNLTGKLAISMIALLSLLIGPVSVKAGLVCAFGQEARVSDSGYLSGNSVTTYNTISGHNAAIDDTTGIACPENISTYTDLNSCDALITSGLNLLVPNHLITTLTWTMEGATNAQSPSAGVNQIGPYVFNEGTTFVRYHFRDIYGSSNTCMFEVVVADNQSPRFINSPGNITTSNSQGDCNARVTWSEPVIKDNCVSSGQLVVESNYSPGDIFPVGTTEVVYRVSDGLNEAEHRFNVLVVDNEQPYLVAPNPKVIVCGEEVEDAFTTWEQFEKAGGKTSDNCEVDYESFRYVSQKSSGIRCPYIITRTYSIADISGNVASVNRLIEVTGEEPQINQEEPDESEPVLKSGTEATSVTITLVGKVDVSCYGGTDGSIDIDTTSTNGPITSILWSPGGQTTLDISGLSAGNYSITVTDGDGSNSLNVTIDQPNELNATVSSTDITCNGSDDGTITVSNPTGGYGTYQVSIDGSIWNNISTSSPYTFNNLTPASYTVQIRDVAHPTCTKSLESKTITQPAVLNAVVTPTNVTCNGANDGTITVSNPTGGYGTYQVSINGSTWNNVSTSSPYTFNNLSPASYTVQIRDAAHTSCVENLGTINITQPTILNASVGSTMVTCNGANDGTITVSNPTGGYGTYQVFIDGSIWNNVSTSSPFTFSNLSPANYTVQIRDAAYPLCTRSISIVTITQPTQLTATIEITDSILCYNGTASIKIEATGGTSPYTYHFEGKSANTNGIFADIPVGNYGWSVTDANGCTTPVQILTVTQPPQLAATADAPDVTCNGQTTTVTISASGGTSPLSYTLNGVTKTNGTFTGITAGTYTWSVKDANNCTPVSDNITINQPTPITITSANVTTPIPCNGGTGAVTIIATGGTGPLSYTFNGQTNTAGVFTGIYAGTNLSYSVTDANGCGPVFGAIDITQPDAIAATASVTNPISCNGGTATVTIAAAGGTGSISYTFNGVTQSSNVFTGITPGANIPWSVTDANNCGPVTGTITVSQPSALTASVSETSSITCFGGTAEIRITASGGTGTKTYSFQGQPDNTTGIFTGITGAVAPGTSYTWSVTDANGCMVSGNYAVQQPTPVEITSIGSNSAICQGQTLTLTSTAEGGTGNRTFSWTGPNGFTSNSPNPSITNATPAASGTYTLTVTDANGCYDEEITTVTVHPTPVVTATPATQAVCHNSPTTAIVFSGAGSYTWINDNTSIGLAASGTGNIPSFTATNDGNTPVTASITITPEGNGCTGIPITATITVNPIPDVIPTNNSPFLCDDGTTNIVLSSEVSGTSFDWTGSNGTSGSGNIIQQYLSNPGTVIYTITPKTDYCTGSPVDVPVQVISSDFDLDVYITSGSIPSIACPGQEVSISFNGNAETGPEDWTRIRWETRFEWTNTNTEIGLGASDGPTSGNGGTIEFTTQNNTDEDQTSVITIVPIPYYQTRPYIRLFGVWIPIGGWSDWQRSACSGNAESFTITVYPFRANCPDDVVVSADDGKCTATFTPTPPTFECSPQTLTWSMSDGSSGTGNIGSYAFETGTTTVTYEAEDDQGNTSACSFTVTVTDEEAPVISDCPGDFNVPMDAGECGAVISWTEPTANDNCDGVVALTRTDGTGYNSGDLFPSGTTTISYLATDAAGNTSTCSFNIVVAPDDEPPVWICIEDQEVCAPAGSPYTMIGTAWDTEVTENCTGTLTKTYSLSGATTGTGTSLNNVEFNVGTTTVTWTATDINGNSSTCQFDVVINEMPSVSINEGNQSVCLTTGSATFTAAATGTPAPTYQWYKDGAEIPGATGDQLTLNNVQETDAGSYTVEVSNSCGAAVSAPAVLTVSTPPVITAQPASQTDCRGNLVEFDVVANQGNTPYSYYWEMRETSASAWIEAATVDNIEFNADSSQLKVYNIGNPDNPNQAQYRVTVTDACENSDTSTIATLTANEVVSADISVSMVCQGEGTTITAITSGATPLSYQWLFYNGTDWVDLTNGGAYSGVTTATLTINNATPAETGDYRFRAIFPINKPNNISATECQRTLATTDAVTFTVDPGPDIVATATPSTICPDGNVEIKIYDANGIPGNTFSWSRTNETALPGTFTGNTINDTLFISGDINSTSPGTLLTTTFNITGTSPNGCVSTGQVTITVGDDELPNAVCKDITVQLDATGNASITAADVNDESADNCGIATMEVSPSTFDCSNTGGNNVTLTVTDVNGNVATCNATVTVEDTEVPTAVCKDISVELDASGNATIAPADVDNGSSDNCGTPILSLDTASFDCTNLGANTVTLTATDSVGNTATCTATVTVADNYFPVAITATVSQQDTLCLDDSTDVDISITGGVGTIEYTFNGSTNATGQFTVPAGYDYNWSVSNSLGCGTTSGTFHVEIRPDPVTPVFTAGATTLCQDAVNETYTATAVNSTSMTYSVSPGSAGTINASTGEMDWDPAFSGQATVTATANGCNGPSVISSTTVTVLPTPEVTISGNVSVCQNTSPDAEIIFTNPQSLPVTLTYNIDGVGHTINIPANSTATVTHITANVGDFDYSLESVQYQYGPGCSNPLTGSSTITIRPEAPVAPDTITGNDFVLPVSSETYTIDPVANATSYTWSVPSGWSIVSGQGTTSITVTTGIAGETGDITVIAQNDCGDSPASTLAVTINPNLAIVIDPVSQSDCFGNSVLFSVSISGGAAPIVYTWQRQRPSEGSFTDIVGDPDVTYPVDGQMLVSNIGSASNPDGTQYRVRITDNAGSDITSSPATLTVNDVVDMSPVDVITEICEDESTSFSATTGGETPISMVWEKDGTPVANDGVISGDTTTSITFTGARPSDAGEYRLTVTFPMTQPNNDAGNPDNCTITSILYRTLVVNPLPVLAGPAEVCVGQTINWTPNSGGTWISNDPAIATIANDGTVTGISEGSVTFTFTETATDCSSTSASVTVHPLPTGEISGITQICIGDSTDFTVTLTGTAPWDFTYTDGTTPVTISGISTSPYTVRVSPAVTSTYTLTAVNDVYCSATSLTGSADVTVHPLPTAILSGDATICTGTATDLVVDLTGTQPWSITYTDGSTPVTITGITSNPYLLSLAPDTTTTYSLTAVSDANCSGTSFTGTATLTVDHLPTASAGGTETICANATATVSGATATDGTILWTHDGNGTLTDETTLTPTYVADAADAGDTVTLTMTVTSNNACGVATATAIYTLLVDPLPLATAGGSASICTDGSVTVSGASVLNGTILWTHNGTGSLSDETTLTPTYAAGSGDSDTTVTLTLTVTSDNTCAPQTATDIFSIDVLPEAQVNQPGDQEVCTGTSTAMITFTTTNVSGTTTYTWTNSVPSIGLAASGTGNIIAPFTATNSGTDPIVATIEVTPHLTTGGVTCDGPPKIFTITVNPQPVAIAPIGLTFCNDILSDTFALSGTPSGVLFDISGGTAIGIPDATDVASILPFLPVAGSASVTIVPRYNGCTGLPVSFNVTVRPTPVVTIAGGDTVCQNSAPPGIIITNPMTLAVVVTYTINGTTTNTVNVPGRSNVSIAVPTNTAGTFVYNLVSVQYLDSDPPVCANDMISGSATVEVIALPVPTISGPTDICADSTEYTYRTEGGMNNYTWVVSAAGSITAGGTITDSTVTVIWNSGGTHNISIRYNNENGCGAATSTVFPVNVFALPTPTITGSTSACLNASKTYSTQPGMTNYQWTVSDGASITSGGGLNDNSLTVTWDSVGVQTITVNYISPNGCQAFSPSVRNITINPLPEPTVTGPDTVCAGTGGHVYSTESGMSTYIWTVSSGGTVTAGGTSNSNTVTVKWNNNGPQTVRLTYIDPATGCEPENPVVYDVSVDEMPVPTISGLNDVCAGSEENVYRTESGMNAYDWTISSGGTITAGGDGADSVVVTWNTAGSQTVKVNYENANACAATTPTTLNVTVNALPTPNVAGSAVVCLGSTITYSTVAGMTDYQWAVSAGGSIVSGGALTDHQVTITWTSVGAGTISLNYTNASGCNALAPFDYAVTVNDLPSPTISGPSDACNGGAAAVYTTEAGMTGYTWLVPGGTIVGGGNGIDSVVVVWNTAGVQTVSVNYYNANNCAAATPVEYPVNVIAPAPPTCPADMTACTDDGVIILSGASPAGGVYSGPGVSLNGGNYEFNPAAAGPGVHTIAYTLTNICADNCSFEIAVTETPVGTPVNTTICSGYPVDVALISSVPGTTFSWTSTVTSGSVSGNTNCSGSCGTMITDTLTNNQVVAPGSSGTNAVVVYTVTATNGICNSTFTVQVQVRPQIKTFYLTWNSNFVEDFIEVCAGAEALSDNDIEILDENDNLVGHTQIPTSWNPTFLYGPSPIGPWTAAPGNENYTSYYQWEVDFSVNNRLGYHYFVFQITDPVTGCIKYSEPAILNVVSSLIVEAGDPEYLCGGSTVTLSGAYVGGIASSTPTARWSVLSSNPAGVTTGLSSTSYLSNPSTVNFTPPVGYEGEITLALTTNALDGCAAIQDTRTITVVPPSSFIGCLQLADWTFDNSNNAGGAGGASVDDSEEPCLVTLVGSDNGSTTAGSADLLHCTGAGTVSFDWTFLAPPNKIVWHQEDQTVGARSSNNMVVSAPSNLSAGDLIIVTIHVNDNTTVTGLPSGFQAVTANGSSTNGDVTVASFYKIATGSEGTLTFGTTGNVSSNDRIFASRITGHHPTTPIGNSVGRVAYIPYPAEGYMNFDIPAVAATNSNSMLVSTIAINVRSTDTEDVEFINSPIGSTTMYYQDYETSARLATRTVGSGSYTARFSWPSYNSRNRRNMDVAGQSFVINPASNEEDAAYFLLNGVATPLGNTNGATGSRSIAVNSSDEFGFRVGTSTNTGGPGRLIIYNLEMPNDNPVATGTDSIFVSDCQADTYTPTFVDPTVTDDCGTTLIAPDYPQTDTVVVNGCERSQTQTWVYIDECDSLSAPFSQTVVWMVEEPILLACPTDPMLAACTDPDTVTTRYNEWLAGFTASGGCEMTTNIFEIPPLVLSNIACGDTLTFTFKAFDACGQVDSCTSTFTVEPLTTLNIFCPADTVLTACSDTAAIHAAYDAWKAGFYYDGGCASVTDNINTFPALTDFTCGGQLEFIYEVYNSCGQFESCFSTFTVEPPDPVSITVPAGVSLPLCSSTTDIEAAYNTWIAGFTYAGGCNVITNIDSIPALGDLSCGGTLTFTYSVKNGNTACEDLHGETSTFSVADAPNLILSCPTDTTIPGCLGIQAITDAYDTWVDGFRASGGCSVTTNIAEIPELGGLICNGSITFTFIVGNDSTLCSAQDSCTSTFTIGAPPAISIITPPDTVLTGCNTDSTVIAAFNAWKSRFGYTGGCAGYVSESDISVYDLPSSCGGTVTVKYSVWDDCSNLETDSATFTINPDMIVVNAPIDEVQPACQTQMEIDSAFAEWKSRFGFTGGCGTIGTDLSLIDAPDACGGLIVVNYSAQDVCGQVVNQSAIFTIDAPSNVLQEPSFTSPADISVYRDDACLYDADTLITGAPTNLADNCTAAGNLSMVYNDSIAAGSCTGEIIIYRTWTVFDNCLNATSAVQLITVMDSTPPVLNCAADVSDFTDPDACEATGVDIGSTTATDSCGLKSLEGIREGGLLITDPFPAGNTSITWTATDVCGNVSTCTQIVTIIDNQPPEVICPADVDHDADPGLCYRTNVVIPDPTASDNCSLASVIWIMRGATTNNSPASGFNYVGGETFNVGVTTVTYYAVDTFGNLDSCSFTVTIHDITPPNITANCTDASDVAAADACSKVPATLLDPEYNDDCWPNDSLVITWVMTGATNGSGSGYVTGSTFNVGVTTVTYTVTDPDGNFDDCTFTVTILDVTPPVITAGCDDDVSETALPDECSKIPTTLVDPDYYDTCWPNDSLVLTYNITGATTTSGTGSISGIAFNVGVSTVTYTVTDPDGNSIPCSFTVTIVDVTNPVIDMAYCFDVADTADPGNCSKIPAALYEPDYSDTCWPNDSLVLSYEITGATTGTGTGSVVGISFNVGLSYVTYTVSDPDGNTDDCTFEVSISDVTPPNITIAGCQDVTDTTDAANCTVIPAVIQDPVYDDDCWPDSTLTLTWEMTGDTNGSGTGSVRGETFNVGITTVTYTVTDPDGNHDDCSFTVTILPFDMPAFTTGCPPGVSADNDPSICGADLTIPVPTVDDPCNLGYTITNSITVTNDASGYYPVDTTYVVWIITPTLGDPDSCTQMVIVRDVEDPIIATCPPDQTIEGCDTTAFALSPAYSSVLAETDLATFSDAANKGEATDNCGIVAVTYSDVATGTCPLVITRTWTVYDAAGNSATCDQTITIGETTPPVVLCPPDTLQTPTVFDSTFAMLVLPEYSISDNCTDSADIDISWTISGATSGSGTGWIPSPYMFNRGFTNISYTFTDACGNMSTCSFVVFVLYPPEIVCLDSTGTCNDPGDCGNTIEVVDLDNPGVPTNVTGEAINWTWTVYDPGGNQIGTGTSTNVVSPTQIGPVVFPIGTSTIHWYAANLSGHDECDQLFTVEDCEAPTFDSNPITNCVDMLYSATYTTGTPNPNIYSDDNLILDPSPDGYTFEAENLTLDISNLDDNCCDPATLIINWRIDFVDTYDPMNFISNPTLISHDPISGTGQPSDYGSDIFFPGDGVTFTTVTHTITYWVTDCNGNVSPEQTEDIIVTPRPELIKVTN